MSGRQLELFDAARYKDLTAREVEVLQRVALGMTNDLIGKDLFISQETVKSHVRHILDKTGTRNRSQAVAEAIRRGTIS